MKFLEIIMKPDLIVSLGLYFGPLDKFGFEDLQLVSPLFYMYTVFE